MTERKDLGLLLLRVGIGTMFLFHGVPKLMGGLAQWQKLGAAMRVFGIDFLPTFWGFMAAFAEAGGGLCLALGIVFRPSTLLLLATMIVAASHHLNRGDGLAGASHAIEAGVVFLALFFSGAGRYRLRR